MKAYRILLALSLITSVCSAQEPKAGATVPIVEGSKPNIVIIFTDDQGYADLGCYGNQKNKTPRMDQLAREGTRFTSFYAQSVCGPSRSALLTGRYPIRSKGWAMPASEITFAELIRDAVIRRRVLENGMYQTAEQSLIGCQTPRDLITTLGHWGQMMPVA